jgi:hypothetical protein
MSRPEKSMSKDIAPGSEAAKERPSSRRRSRQAETHPDGAPTPRAYAFDDEFDEQEYLRQHPEVADAIAEGHLPNALFHFRVFGTKPTPIRRDGTPRRRKPAKRSRAGGGARAVATVSRK